MKYFLSCTLLLSLLAACGGGADEVLSDADRLVAEMKAAEADARALAAIDLRCTTTANCQVLGFRSADKVCGFSSYAAVSILSASSKAAQEATARNWAARSEYSQVTHELPVPCAAPRPDEGKPLCENAQCRIAPLLF